MKKVLTIIVVTIMVAFLALLSVVVYRQGQEIERLAQSSRTLKEELDSEEVTDSVWPITVYRGSDVPSMTYENPASLVEAFVALQDRNNALCSALEQDIEGHPLLSNRMMVQTHYTIDRGTWPVVPQPVEYLLELEEASFPSYAAYTEE